MSSLQPGEHRRIEFEAQGRPDLPRPKFAGSSNKVGRAYVFRFPFSLHIAEPLEVQESRVGHTAISIYPPFDGHDDGEKRARIPLGNIATRHHTIAPDYNRVAAKNSFIDYHIGRPTNALRIDTIPDAGAEFADRIAGQFIGLARWWTGQWWIGHHDGYRRSHLWNYFDINEHGERQGGVGGSNNLFGFYCIERPLDLERFHNIRGNITNGRFIPRAWDVLLDAIYFQSVGQVERAAIEAAIACETRVVDVAVRLFRDGAVSKSKKNEVANSYDLAAKLDGGMMKLVGKSFREHDRVAFEHLSALRDVRGQLAHGNAPTVRGNHGATPFTTSHLSQMIQAALGAFRWLNQFQPDA